MCKIDNRWGHVYRTGKLYLMYCGDLKWREVQRGAGTGSRHMYMLEKEMAIHFSILAWKIPWTEESGGLQFLVLQRFGHD